MCVGTEWEGVWAGEWDTMMVVRWIGRWISTAGKGDDAGALTTC